MRTSIASLADRLLARLVPRAHADAAGPVECSCGIQQFGDVWCQACQTCSGSCGCDCGPCNHKCPGTICWY